MIQGAIQFIVVNTLCWIERIDFSLKVPAIYIISTSVDYIRVPVLQLASDRKYPGPLQALNFTFHVEQEKSLNL